MPKLKRAPSPKKRVVSPQPKNSPKTKKRKPLVAEQHGGDSRKIESRRKLIAAARMLFSEHGYHETRTQDIADEAGVAHGTFYFHFEDKLDCFLAVVNDVSNEMNQVVQWEMPLNGTPAEMIRTMLGAVYSYARLHPGTIRAVFTDVSILAHDKKHRKEPFTGSNSWFSVVEGWKKKGKAAKDFDTKLFCYLLTGAIRQGDAYIARHPRSEKKVLDHMTRFLVGAIDAS